MSWSAVGVWFLLVLPWVDLLTIQKFSHFQDHGIQTYFGRMNGDQADIYFILAFMNILGAKAAFTLAELAGLLRKGRVRVFRYGPFWV